MKKSMKILLALVLALAVVGGAAFYALGPAMKLSAMMKKGWTAPDTEFTLKLDTPENELQVEGTRLTSVNQTEVKFLTPEGQELTRVVVDGQTTYLDFWPLFDTMGEALFEFIGQDSLMDQIPGFLRQSGLIAIQTGRCSEARVQARTAILTMLKDSILPDLMDEAAVKRAEEGVVVTWEPEKLAAVFTRAGERLNAQDRELYVQWTALVRAWGQELEQEESLLARMLGKVVLGIVQQREKNQAQGVADLHASLAERSAALADQVQQYGPPELHVWETDHSIAQRLKWTTAQGESRVSLELYPTTRTSVDLPGQTETPAEENMT